MEGSPGVRHVYRVSDDGSGAPECVTCPPHTDCLYTEASIAPGGAAYIQVNVADNGEIIPYFVFWVCSVLLMVKGLNNTVQSKVS